MKYLVTILAFVVTLGLTVQTLAADTPHAKGHGDLDAKMNSLYPIKQKDVALGLRPSVANVKSPSFLSTVAAGTVKLEWEASNGATDYHVQVATDPNFKWLLVNEKFVKGTTYDFTKAEAGIRYFWRVAGFKADNTASFTKSNFSSSAFNVK